MSSDKIFILNPTTNQWVNGITDNAVDLKHIDDSIFVINEQGTLVKADGKCKYKVSISMDIQQNANISGPIYICLIRGNLNGDTERADLCHWGIADDKMYLDPDCGFPTTQLGEAWKKKDPSADNDVFYKKYDTLELLKADLDRNVSDSNPNPGLEICLLVNGLPVNVLEEWEISFAQRNSSDDGFDTLTSDIAVKNVSGSVNNVNLRFYLETHNKSDICFPEGTPIRTDQGVIEIQNITKKNTIRGHPVRRIVISVNKDDYLISIRKHAFSHNYPNSSVLVSKNHGIYTEPNSNQYVRAYHLVNGSTIRKVHVGKHKIYNILLDHHSYMHTSGLKVETMCPEHAKKLK